MKNSTTTQNRKATTKSNQEKSPTRDEINVEFFEHNLDCIKAVFNNKVEIHDSKILEIAAITNELADLVRNHERRIKMIMEGDEINWGTHAAVVSRMKLDLIQMIAKF